MSSLGYVIGITIPTIFKSLKVTSVFAIFPVRWYYFWFGTATKGDILRVSTQTMILLIGPRASMRTLPIVKYVYFNDKFRSWKNNVQDGFVDELGLL